MSCHFERSSQPAAFGHQQVELTHAARVNLGGALRSDSWNVSVEIPRLRRVVRLHDHVPRHAKVTDGGGSIYDADQVRSPPKRKYSAWICGSIWSRWVIF